MKTSDTKIFSDSQLQEFINQNDYASATEHLFNSQLKTWELMKKNYDELKNVETESFWFDGFKMTTQFNPGRIKSTSAEVDEKSVANRPCFLCTENLPEEQKGINLRSEFIILCNPYPIFPQHFTISTLRHKPQRIKEHLIDFLEIAKLFYPKYTLIYNGPACGASAPDHLHFQAGTKNYIPIENDIRQLKNEFGKIIKEDEALTITFVNDGLRRMILLESIEQLQIEKIFGKFLKVYEKFTVAYSEPMLNLICNYDEEFGWSLIIFLRSKHRPELYYKNDLQKILISPAAIDMAGLIIVPREEDFNKVDQKLVQSMIDEVSLDSNTFEAIEILLKQS